jgi:putative SOS response-associated peptidase YedK
MTAMKPKDKVPVVLLDRAGDRCLAQLEWGFIPGWDRNLDLRGKLYNLRVETILESLGTASNTRIREAYADAIRERRAVIPASDALERSRMDGQLYRLLPKRGDALFIASLWSHVDPFTGQAFGTVGMITTEHEQIGRVPLFLSPLAVDTWLSALPWTKAWGATFLEQNRYTGNSLFEAARKPKRCAEPSAETSPQTRLSLP